MLVQWISHCNSRAYSFLGRYSSGCGTVSSGCVRQSPGPTTAAWTCSAVAHSIHALHTRLCYVPARSYVPAEFESHASTCQNCQIVQGLLPLASCLCLRCSTGREQVLVLARGRRAGWAGLGCGSSPQLSLYFERSVGPSHDNN